MAEGCLAPMPPAIRMLDTPTKRRTAFQGVCQASSRSLDWIFRNGNVGLEWQPARGFRFPFSNAGHAPAINDWLFDHGSMSRHGWLRFYWLSYRSRSLGCRASSASAG